jgi:hypothetical protein
MLSYVYIRAVVFFEKGIDHYAIILQKNTLNVHKIIQ